MALLHIPAPHCQRGHHCWHQWLPWGMRPMPTQLQGHRMLSKALNCLLPPCLLCGAGTQGRGVCVGQAEGRCRDRGHGQGLRLGTGSETGRAFLRSMTYHESGVDKACSSTQATPSARAVTSVPAPQCTVGQQPARHPTPHLGRSWCYWWPVVTLLAAPHGRVWGCAKGKAATDQGFPSCSGSSSWGEGWGRVLKTQGPLL